MVSVEENGFRKYELTSRGGGERGALMGVFWRLCSRVQSPIGGSVRGIWLDPL